MEELFSAATLSLRLADARALAVACVAPEASSLRCSGKTLQLPQLLGAEVGAEMRGYGAPSNSALPHKSHCLSVLLIHKTKRSPASAESQFPPRLFHCGALTIRLFPFPPPHTPFYLRMLLLRQVNHPATSAEPQFPPRLFHGALGKRCSCHS